MHLKAIRLKKFNLCHCFTDFNYLKSFTFNVWQKYSNKENEKKTSVLLLKSCLLHWCHEKEEISFFQVESFLCSLKTQKNLVSVSEKFFLPNSEKISIFSSFVSDCFFCLKQIFRSNLQFTVDFCLSVLYSKWYRLIALHILELTFIYYLVVNLL